MIITWKSYESIIADDFCHNFVNPFLTNNTSE